MEQGELYTFPRFILSIPPPSNEHIGTDYYPSISTMFSMATANWGNSMFRISYIFGHSCLIAKWSKFFLIPTKNLPKCEYMRSMVQYLCYTIISTYWSTWRSRNIFPNWIRVIRICDSSTKSGDFYAIATCAYTCISPSMNNFCNSFQSIKY